MGATTGRRRGHIEQRPGGSYRVSVYAGIDPITRQRRYLRETAPTKKEAEKACTRLQGQVDEKRHPRTKVTLGELLDQWMEVSNHETSTSEKPCVKPLRVDVVGGGLGGRRGGRGRRG